MNYAELKTIKAKEEFIREKIKTDEQWMLRGLVAIWKKQTADEQATWVTRHSNSVGFTGVDGGFFSKMAERVHNGWGLSEKQAACVRRAMPKYAGQLRKIADKVI